MSNSSDDLVAQFKAQGGAVQSIAAGGGTTLKPSIFNSTEKFHGHVIDEAISGIVRAIKVNSKNRIYIKLETRENVTPWVLCKAEFASQLEIDVEGMFSIKDSSPTRTKCQLILMKSPIIYPSNATPNPYIQKLG